MIGGVPLNIVPASNSAAAFRILGMISTPNGLRSTAELVPALATLRPDLDTVGLRAWAKNLSLLDPDVLGYHAEGRLRELLEGMIGEAELRQISCPVLLLQGDPSAGGITSDRYIEYALSVIPNACHAQIEGAGHDLGLSTWQVAPLLRVVTGFLESL